MNSPVPWKVDVLGEQIQEAWIKYHKFFGEPVYGTLPQIKAMLELMPRKRELFQSVNRTPLFAEMLDLLQSQHRKLEDQHAGWDDHKRRYCNVCDLIRRAEEAK